MICENYPHAEMKQFKHECQITVIRNQTKTISLMESSNEILFETSYASFIGGSENDVGQSIAIDSDGSIYVAGSTDSSDFLDLDINGLTDCFVLKYDSTETELIYATIIGGTSKDELISICVDFEGNVYGTGRTTSNDFPTVNAFNYTNSGAGDCFVFKLNPNGDDLIYSTFVGGTENDFASDIAIDSQGCAYVTGSTFCRNGRDYDFPSVNPFDDTWNGENDAFVFKLNSNGDSLEYSTIIGGAAGDWLDSIAVDSQGNAVVTGNAESENWPMVNSYDPVWSSSLPNLPDVVLFKLNYSGNGLLWSTYIGGNGSDYGRSVTLDSSDNIYLVGATSSLDFPLKNSIQSTFNGGWSDCFILKMSSDGQSIIYSSYLGGTEHDEARDIVFDDSGCAYITGYSNSLDFPITNTTNSKTKGDYDFLVIKLNAVGNSSILSTYLGGSEDDRAYSIAVDNDDAIYITGRTCSLDFPTFQASDPSYNGGEEDCILVILCPSANDNISSYLWIFPIMFLIISITASMIVAGVLIQRRKTSKLIAFILHFSFH